MTECFVYTLSSYSHSYYCDLLSTNTLDAQIVVNACKQSSDLVIIGVITASNRLKLTGKLAGEHRFDYYPEMGVLIVDKKRYSPDYVAELFPDSCISLIREMILQSKNNQATHKSLIGFSLRMKTYLE